MHRLATTLRLPRLGVMRRRHGDDPASEPSFDGRPELTGDKVVGATVTIRPPRVSGHPVPTVEWRLQSRPAGDIGAPWAFVMAYAPLVASFTVSGDQEGNDIRVQLRATNSEGAAIVSSIPLGPIIELEPEPGGFVPEILIDFDPDLGVTYGTGTAIESIANQGTLPITLAPHGTNNMVDRAGVNAIQLTQYSKMRMSEPVSIEGKRLMIAYEHGNSSGPIAGMASPIMTLIPSEHQGPLVDVWVNGNGPIRFRTNEPDLVIEDGAGGKHIVEFEVVGTTGRAWMDGVPFNPINNPALANFEMDIIGGNSPTASPNGFIYRSCIFTSDGGPDTDDFADNLRARMASRYGVTLS